MSFSVKAKQNKKKFILYAVALVLVLSVTVTALYMRKAMSRTDEDGMPVYENYTSVRPAKYFRFFGTIAVYDAAYLDKIFPEEKVTLEELNHACRANENISVRYKDIICEFNRRLLEKYPSPDYRPYLENLSTMKVLEMTSEEICAKTGKSNSYACYDIRENAVCVPYDEPFAEGEYPFQALYHELCHAVRRYYRTEDGRETAFTFSDANFSCTILEEALNTEVAVSLLNYDEEHPSYAYACNAIEIIMECTDAFTLADYFIHPASWFAVAVNEATGRNDSGYYLRLLEEEFTEINEKETHSVELYREFYEFLTEIYFSKHYRAGMPAERKAAIGNELFSALTKGCKEIYRTSESLFTELAAAYGE